MTNKIKMLLLASLTIVACNNNDDATVDPSSSDGKALTSGTADFSNYVAVGNSLTAGFSDGALFIEGQKTSWTAILADQFKLVGGGEFKIPFMTDNLGGFNAGGVQIPSLGTRLYFNGSGPAPVSGISGTSVTAVLTGKFNNMGVPGAKSFHLLANGYGSANPYFGRFASSPTASVIKDATDQSPTFFTLWIGNNDVLGYATTGGDGTNPITPAVGAPGVGFDGSYTALITQLTANGAKGAISNIPYVTSVPFFTTVPTNPVPGLPPTSAGQLNQLFGGINSALTASGLPTRFATLASDDGNPATVEANPLLLKDESLINISAQITAALTPTFGAGTAAYLGSIYGQARHASNAAATRDYVLLTARTIIGTTQAGAPAPFNTVGISYPMQDNAILTASETTEVKIATDAYNLTIKGLADSKGLAFVNANAILNEVATTGVVSNGYTVRSAYVSGGGFSLDGVHPSPRGYALIANEFMKSINATYGSNLKAVDLNKYRILFPKNL